MNVSIDLNALKEKAMIGVRRAAAFMSLGAYPDSRGLPKSLALDEGFGIHWFPEPLLEDDAKSIVKEYNTWLIGSALKELDQFFNLFLNEVWAIIRLMNYHGRALPANYVKDKKFNDDTNVANKLKEVAKKIDIQITKFNHFSGYTFARNALTHNAGIVRDRDVGKGRYLALEWRTPEIIFKNSSTEITVGISSKAFPTAPFSEETSVMFRMGKCEKKFKIGEQIVLNGYDLSGIILTYQICIDEVVLALQKHLYAKGVFRTDNKTQQTIPLDSK